MFILWFGWFGFQSRLAVGSQWRSNRITISHVFLTTNLAAATGGLATMTTTWLKYGKPSFSLTLNGILAGLVGITAGCDLVSPAGAVVIGAVCGVVLPFSIEFIDMKLHVDDPVGASSVHGVCGILGTLLVGLFSLGSGALYGHGFNQLGAQLFGILCIDGWTLLTGLVLFGLLNRIIGLRVDERIEEEGSRYS